MKSKKISNLWHHSSSSNNNGGGNNNNNNNNNSTTGNNNGNNSPIKKYNSSNHYEGIIFGVGLNEIVKRYSSINNIPSIVTHITENIRSNSQIIHVEGIFRIPGSNMKLQQLKKYYDQGKINSKEQLNERCDDIHTQASLLKLYIRELPDPLFTFALYEEFVRSHSTLDKPSRVGSLKLLLNKLPPAHYQLIKYLAALLKEIASHSQINKMTSTNLAIIFGPTVMRPKNEDVVKMIEDARHVNGVFLLVIDEFDYLFQNTEFPSFILNPHLQQSQSQYHHTLSPTRTSSNSILSLNNVNSNSGGNNSTTTSSPIRIGSQNNSIFNSIGTSNSQNSSHQQQVVSLSPNSYNAKRIASKFSSIEELNSPSSPFALEDFLNGQVLRSPPPVPPPSPSSSPQPFVTTTPQKTTPKFSILLPTNNNNNINNTNNNSNPLLSPTYTPPSKSNNNNGGISSPLLSPLPPASPRNSLILQDGDNSELIRNLIHKTCSLLFEKDFFVNDTFEIPIDEYLIPVISENNNNNNSNSNTNSPVSSPGGSFHNNNNNSSSNKEDILSSPRKSRVIGIPTSNGESTSSPQLRSLLKSHVNNLNITNNGVTIINNNNSSNNNNNNNNSGSVHSPLIISNRMNQSQSPPLINLVNSDNTQQKNALEIAYDHLNQMRKDLNRPSEPNLMTQKELRDEKSAIKKELREFDLQFKKDRGILPKKSDKEIMRPLYQKYREIKVLIDYQQRLNSNSLTPNSTISNSSLPSISNNNHHQQQQQQQIQNNSIETTNNSNNNLLKNSNGSINSSISSIKSVSIASPPNITSNNNKILNSISPPLISPPLISNSNNLINNNNSSSSTTTIPNSIIKTPISSSSYEKLSKQELKDRYQRVKLEKRNMQIELHKYQSEFMKKHGRKVQFIEDRIPVQNEYEKYKDLKMEIFILEKLLNINNNNNNSTSSSS